MRPFGFWVLTAAGFWLLIVVIYLCLVAMIR